MASSIGPAVSRQATVRPVLMRVIRPASESTSRCFIIAGSDIANGRASSLTDTLSASLKPRHDRPPRRVGKRREGAVEGGLLILNHGVKYCAIGDARQVPIRRCHPGRSAARAGIHTHAPAPWIPDSRVPRLPG